MQEFHVKVDLIFINEIFGMLTSEVTEEESVSLNLILQTILLSPLIHCSFLRKNFSTKIFSFIVILCRYTRLYNLKRNKKISTTIYI